MVQDFSAAGAAMVGLYGCFYAFLCVSMVWEDIQALAFDRVMVKYIKDRASEHGDASRVTRLLLPLACPKPALEHPGARGMHHAPYIMHHAPYIMHHAPCTVHRAPCTVHPGARRVPVRRPPLRVVRRGWPGPVLTRTSRGLRTVRTGYVYQPPACCTGRWHRVAAAPRYVHRTCISLGRAVRTAHRGPPGLGTHLTEVAGPRLAERSAPTEDEDLAT